jgi:hypothetical protein
MIGLVDRPIDIPWRQGVELRLQLSVEPINVMNINLVREAPISGRCPLRSFLFQNAEARSPPMDIGIVGIAKEHFEAQDMGEEGYARSMSSRTMNGVTWMKFDTITLLAGEPITGCSQIGDALRLLERNL